ncbi:DUF6707 family protein [Ruminococcus albus]|uniref:Uncharacterized protein n=1 Tax=Ruminococcus albus TaxID=1264 RepID=A0A1I1R1R9_RUMAL|nr:DUF6707 family protein [Ruminococcus albus]SFD28157.1 hypothetical protein SAMN02910406_03575 [Ruminococcus albus]
MTELIERISNTVDKKKVRSYCNKILKKCSFKSSRDLQNISGLATWLYIYGYYDEMIEVCDLVKDMEFEGDYDLWFIPEMTMCLKARVFRERGMLKEAQLLVDKINEQRDPSLYVNLVDEYEENMDENIAEEEKDHPRSLAYGWRFCKLQFAINYREPGGFPISDERFDNDIKELVSFLRQVK